MDSSNQQYGSLEHAMAGQITWQNAPSQQWRNLFQGLQAQEQ